VAEVTTLTTWRDYFSFAVLGITLLTTFLYAARLFDEIRPEQKWTVRLLGPLALLLSSPWTTEGNRLKVRVLISLAAFIAAFFLV
jgi:hypothetical protein